ncbi:MAG TPA: PQQ-binding-like beta-propeller repeat protein [Vicinamibacterales bacterium]|nr:PQQ-binding-like beta-propeller repeat protein [Vicinamibacterales bacterium]
MTRMAVRSASMVLLLAAAGVAWTGLRLSGQAARGAATAGPGSFVASTAKGDWPSYTGDTRGSRYSPLAQITAENFNDLEVAWRFKTDSLGTRPEYKLEGTPLVVNGIMYTTAGTRRSVISLDAATGELLWVHRYPEGTRGANAPRQLSGRGLAYWTDGRGDERIIYFTPGYRMIALHARTGQPVRTFGTDGVVDLKVGAVFGNRQPIDLETGEIGIHSTPVVVKNVVLVGSSMKEGMTVTTHNNTKGLARAYDARTGKLLWTFHTIPRPGEFGSETWLDNSWAVNGNAGIWTQISVDEELGLVYLPVETPTSDFYGGKRPGNNLFGESLVCVDLATGRRRWHFQFVHHPIWNDDMSSAPLIADVTVDGTPRKVVAVPSKQAWLYVFDRVTGEPIWPIEEKPVPKGDVPGEWYAPTQPHPPAALMYGRNTVTEDDLIDFTPELRAQAKKQLERYKWLPGVVYTPPIVGNTSGLLGAINIGHINGGTNWPGGGYDPELRTVFVHANTSSVQSGSVAPPPPGFSDLPYQDGVVGQPFRLREAAGTGTYADVSQRARGGQPGGQAAGAAQAGTATPAAPASGRGGGGGEGGGGLTVQGLSIIKPPYSVLAAIDLDKGAVKWRVPHGETPDVVRNHPLLKGMNIPRTGQGSSVGLVITKTLVVLGESQFTTLPDRPRGAMLRAYDKGTGKEVGAVFMPAPQSGSPMTYLAKGKQYIVVAVSGGPYSGEYLAFALPGDAAGAKQQ